MSPLGGGLIDAQGISDNGLIAGSYLVNQAALLDGTTLTPLGTLGGGSSAAFAVNDAGQVVGASSLPSGSCLPTATCDHAFLWQGGVMTDLGSFGGIVSGKSDAAYAINAAGHAAGQSNTVSDGNWLHPTFWDGGSLNDLGARGSAYGINDADVVVGETHMNPQATIMHAARWANGSMITLGTLFGDVSSQARDINNLGQIVGWSYGPSSRRAFIWENGVMSQLPSLGDGTNDVAYSINDAGDIVGLSQTDSGPVRAVLWRKVQNQAPTSAPGGPYTGAEGAPIALDGSASSDPENTPLTYDWDFGDGSPHGSGPTPSHAFPDNATYTVTLTVSDGALSHSSTTTVITSNVAPTGSITAPAGATAPQGNVTLTLGNIVEPSPIDAAALQFRFNCGSSWGPIVSSPTTTCALPTTGSKTLRVSVRDKDGAQSTYQKVVSITNVGPSVTILSPTTVTIPAGTALTFSASFTDPGTSDSPWPARVQWGGGLGVQALGNKTPGTPFGASKIYPTPGTFTAIVEVKDKFGAFAQRGSITVVVQ